MANGIYFHLEYGDLNIEFSEGKVQGPLAYWVLKLINDEKEEACMFVDPNQARQEVCIFVKPDQARQIAETILAGLEDTEVQAEQAEAE